MSENAGFAEKLWLHASDAIAAGSRRFLLWAVTPALLHVLRKFHDCGLTGLVAGIVDPRPEIQGQWCADFRVFPPADAVSLGFDSVIVCTDEEKEGALVAVASLSSPSVRIIIAGTAHLAFRDNRFSALLDSLLLSSRAAGYPHMLVHLYQCLVHLAERGIVGDIAEFGVYKGATALFLARAARALGLQSRVFAFDTFRGFPGRRSVLDLYQARHDEFREYRDVERNCKDENITLVPGDICETYTRLQNVRLSLCFFDTDNYSPTRASLDLCYEQTVPGGILAFDHYFCDERWLYTIGERIAATQALAGKRFFHLHGTGVFVKI